MSILVKGSNNGINNDIKTINPKITKNAFKFYKESYSSLFSTNIDSKVDYCFYNDEIIAIESYKNYNNTGKGYTRYYKLNYNNSYIEKTYITGSYNSISSYSCGIGSYNGILYEFNNAEIKVMSIDNNTVNITETIKIPCECDIKYSEMVCTFYGRYVYYCIYYDNFTHLDKFDMHTKTITNIISGNSYNVEPTKILVSDSNIFITSATSITGYFGSIMKISNGAYTNIMRFNAKNNIILVNDCVSSVTNIDFNEETYMFGVHATYSGDMYSIMDDNYNIFGVSYVYNYDNALDLNQITGDIDLFSAIIYNNLLFMMRNNGSAYGLMLKIIDRLYKFKIYKNYLIYTNKILDNEYLKLVSDSEYNCYKVIEDVELELSFSLYEFFTVCYKDVILYQKVFSLNSNDGIKHVYSPIDGINTVIYDMNKSVYPIIKG